MNKEVNQKSNELYVKIKRILDKLDQKIYYHHYALDREKQWTDVAELNIILKSLEELMERWDK